MTLKQAHKECKAMWKWLSENSNVNKSDKENKIAAAEALGIDVSFYINLCPYCEYTDEFCHDCSKCPVFIEYDKTCSKIGYNEWQIYKTQKNAKTFYNKIKDL